MKLISKIKKWFRRSPPPKPKQEGIYFSADDLEKMMSKQMFGDRCHPVTSKPEAATKRLSRFNKGSLGPIYDGLIEHIPSLKRMIIRAFMERKQDTALGYYSDGELNPLLIERGSRYDSGKLKISRQATPTVLITKRPEYKRKTDGKYQMQEPIVSSVANGRVVRA